MKVILTLFIIVTMIALHEFGHFAAGKTCGAGIAEFAISFGPPLLSKKSESGTTYSLRMIPLGGFCAFDEGDRTGAVDRALNELPVVKRLIIFAAGPFMNILTCVVLCFCLCFITGLPTQLPIIDSVQPGYAASEVLREGDVVTAVNGEEIKTADELTEKKTKLDAGDVTLTVYRDGEKMEVTLTPKNIRGTDMYSLGILFKQENHRLPFTDSIANAFKITGDLAESFWTTIAGLLTGAIGLSSLTSIIGAANTISVYASASQISTYILYCAYISLNLGLFNLFPIPALDGFKIAEGLVECVTKKTLPESIKERLITVCMGVLFGFAGYMILRDVFFILS